LLTPVFYYVVRRLTAALSRKTVAVPAPLLPSGPPPTADPDLVTP
jgi:hypothetical protein